MFEVVSVLLALYLLLSIAFPERFIPELKLKRKKVGSSYWGVYEGRAVTDAPEETTIDVPKPARFRKVVAGSSQYSNGKGLSLRK
ncbi:MAG TPA: hypothetical protein V6D22_13865 [Candidatus Obscuribacterales bacterium]